MDMHERSFETRSLALGLLVLAAPLGGCGGSSAPPNCGIEQPCGGDVVGAWNFAGVCSNVTAANAELMAICPGASIGGSSIALLGSLIFNADGTYTASNWHETFSLTETVPLSCAGAGATSCTENNGTTTDTQDGVKIAVTTACTGTTVCTCRLAGNLSIVSDTGAYTIAGTTLDMAGPATSGTFPYCVEEKRLHLMELSATMTTPMGQAVITSDIVAQKQ
jgi:hypothetical protein